MTEFPCKVCDRSILESESEYYHYLATLLKKNNKSLYKKYTINNVNLDEVNKIINNHISTHNKNFNFFLSNVNL